MRKALALMISCGAAITAFSQTISVKINGNKNEQVIVDGKSYTIDNSNSANQRTITITDLPAGTHKIQVMRTARNKTNATTSFTTRTGYETTVTVAANGAVHIKDKLVDAAAAKVPMTDADFTTLLQRTRNHLRNSSRITAVSNALSNPGNYFSTAQLRLLLESFDGEVKRLELAKKGYSKVTDQLNFASLASLFAIQSNKDALSAYIKSQGNDVAYSYSETFRAPLNESRFNTVMDDLEAQWQEGARLSYLIDILDNSSNYFSVAQASEMIRMIGDQSSRLHLAKAVYSRLTDPQNAAQLHSLFTEDMYLNSFKSYIPANSNNNTTGIHNYGKIAMTESDFSKAYGGARNHFRASSVLREVTGFLSNENNYFTSYQARQIIMLVKSESERLQLAKTAYRGITDPNNFLVQMNDLFSWQANRDILADYVSSYVPR